MPSRLGLVKNQEDIYVLRAGLLANPDSPLDGIATGPEPHAAVVKPLRHRPRSLCLKAVSEQQIASLSRNLDGSPLTGWHVEYLKTPMPAHVIVEG